MVWKLFQNLVSSLGLISGSDNGILPTILQVLGNVSLAGEEHRSVVWRQFFPHKFLDIAKVRGRETCDPLCMVIYSCAESSNERSEELFAVQGQHIIVEIIQTITTAGFRQDRVKLLLSKICLEEAYCPAIFSKVSEAVETRTSNENWSRRYCCLQWFFVMHLKSAVGVVDFSTRRKLPLPTGSVDADIIGYTLSILRDISACDPRISNQDKKGDTIDMLMAAGLIKFLVKLLLELEPPSVIKKAMLQSDAENETTSKGSPPKWGQGGSEVRNLFPVLQTQRGCFRMTRMKIGSKNCII